jgi:hypothetical protein
MFKLEDLTELYYLDYYDRPIMYIARNGAFVEYLIYWAENSDIEIWLAVELSYDLHKSFLLEELPVCDVFLKAPVVHVLKYSLRQESFLGSEIVVGSTLNKSWLPDSDVFANG